jgi:hypothetical protein
LFVVIFALFAAVFINLFERRLSFVQALLIAGWSLFLSTLLLVVDSALRPALHLPQSVDAISSLVWLAITGMLITRQAQKYGIEKPGRLGLGAKVTLPILALGWAFVGVYLIVSNVV